MKLLYRILPAACWALSLLAACIEPLDIEIEESGRFLVVEGMITDAEGPYTVRLTWSNPADALAEVVPVEGALAWIESAGGETEALTPAADGAYISSLGGIRGTIGEDYRLRIDLPDGGEYLSDWMRMQSVPPIDRVYYEFEERPLVNGTEEGVQIFLDTRDSTGETRYYRWDWIETWRYMAPFPAYYEYLGNNNTRPLSEIHDVCWQTTASQAISVASSVQNATAVIARHPLVFISTEDHRLQARYSVLVRQYALGEAEYLFWNTMKETAENAGTLFDRQPASTTGNVHNVNDPAEPVLGYFSASGVSEKRLYISRNEFFALVDEDFFRPCLAAMDTIPIGPGADAAVFGALAKGQVFYDYYREVVNISGYMLTTPDCSDCVRRGGTTERPDWWID